MTEAPTRNFFQFGLVPTGKHNMHNTHALTHARTHTHMHTNMHTLTHRIKGALGEGGGSLATQSLL